MNSFTSQIINNNNNNKKENEKKENKNKLFITIGPQCAGKTTYLSNYKEKETEKEKKEKKEEDKEEKEEEEEREDNNNKDIIIDIAMDNIDRTYEKITIKSIKEYQENGLLSQEWNRNIYRQSITTRIFELNINEQIPLLLLFTEEITLNDFNLHIMELVNNNKMNEEDGLLVCEVTEKLYNDGYRMESQTIDLFIRDAMGYSVQQAQSQLEEACKNPNNKYVSWGNTNLSPNMYKFALQIASQTQRKVEFIKWGYELPSVPLKELQTRNTLRYLKTGRYVTLSIVRDFFKRANNFMTPPDLNSSDSLFELSKKYDETLINLAGYEILTDGTITKSSTSSSSSSSSSSLSPNRTEENKYNQNRSHSNQRNNYFNNNNETNGERRTERFNDGNNRGWKKNEQYISKERTELSSLSSSTTTTNGGTWRGNSQSTFNSNSNNNNNNNNNKYSYLCYQLTFNTKDSITPPLDSPSPKLEEMPQYLKELLISLSVLCLCWILFDMTILCLFRNRRLVKMSQLSLTIITLIGSLLSIIRVFLSSIDLSNSICMGIFWTSHLSFLLVFSTLLVRAWRISAITSSLKKVVFGDLKCMKIIAGLLIIGMLSMMFESIFGGIRMIEVVIEDNQFSNTYQMRCDYSNGLNILGLSIYESIIIIIGFYFCWKIRKVNLTVCNTTSILDASFTVIVTIIVMVTVLYTVDIEPIYRQFYVALAFILVTGRVVWVLDSQVIYLVLMGYDLDKSLTLHQNAWSVKFLLPRSSRTTKVSIENSQTDRDMDTFSRKNDLARFAKDKNQDELTAEILRANRELQSLNNYIASLENLRFAADAVNNSSSYVDSGHQYRLEELVQVVEKDVSEVPPTPAAHDPPTPANETLSQKFSH